MRVEVFLDDISLSSDEGELLGAVYDGLLDAVTASGFRISAGKSSGPARRVQLFNCMLEQGRVEVLAARRATGQGERFEAYCRAVKAGNSPCPRL